MKSHPEIPRAIGRYDIERLLGSGAMGHVYLARDPELDRKVAIKTVRDHGLGDGALETFLTRFRNEARAAARLHHPSIVAVYDVGQDDNVGPYLVFEYVPGLTLSQVLTAKGPLDSEALLRLVDEVGDALDTAHRAGVIHRDIKPDNLLINENGRAKLADFGVARVPNAALTKEGQFLGTPCYSAPETLMSGEYSPASDLFSLAAVVYEAVTGKRAFPGTEAVAVAHKVINEDPVPPREAASNTNEVTAAVEAVILKGLSKDPTRRFASASELASALRSAVHDQNFALDATAFAKTLNGKPSARTKGKGLATSSFVALVIFALALGVTLIVLLAPSASETVVDAPDAATGREAGSIDRERKSRGNESETHGNESDHATIAPVAERPTIERAESPATSTNESEVDTMSAFEREEAAKDALSHARSLIADGDTQGAFKALKRAEQLDPGNPDVGRALATLSDAGSR